jgi:hypothetical protein
MEPTLNPELLVPYQERTRAEVRQLAMDIADGQVFGTWDLPGWLSDPNHGIVFMPILLGGTGFTLEQLEYDPRFPKGGNTPIVFYEYIHRAGPRAVNGYPCFFSCYTLLGRDVQRTLRLARKFQRAKQQMINGK